jgi:hypothetical protein
VSCFELACLVRLAWDIFLGAMVISSNDLMIIYSGIVFYCHLVITLLDVFLLCFLVAGAKRKRRRRKERKKMCSFLGINILVFFYSLL